MVGGAWRRSLSRFLKVITLNVNGIRSAAAKGLFRWLDKQRADVICLQYHCHIPAPDPLTSPDAEDRLGYYQDQINGAPTVFIAGKVGPPGGGPAGSQSLAVDQVPPPNAFQVKFGAGGVCATAGPAARHARARATRSR